MEKMKKKENRRTCPMEEPLTMSIGDNTTNNDSVVDMYLGRITMLFSGKEISVKLTS